jgi:hypothetical protein
LGAAQAGAAARSAQIDRVKNFFIRAFLPIHRGIGKAGG